MNKTVLSYGPFSFSVRQDWLLDIYKQFEIEEAEYNGLELTEEEIESRALADWKEPEFVMDAIQAATEDPKRSGLVDMTGRHIDVVFKIIKEYIGLEWDSLQTGKLVKAYLSFYGEREDEYIRLVIDDYCIEREMNYDSAMFYLEGLVRGYKMGRG